MPQPTREENSIREYSLRGYDVTDLRGMFFLSYFGSRIKYLKKVGRGGCFELLTRLKFGFCIKRTYCKGKLGNCPGLGLSVGSVGLLTTSSRGFYIVGAESLTQ